MRGEMIVHTVRIADGGDILEGDLHIPEDTVGLVIFAQWDPIRAAVGSYAFGALRRQA